MLLDPSRIASILSVQTGLTFEGRSGVSSHGETMLTFSPAEHSQPHTFSIVAILKFRRLEIEFQPGAFAGDLLDAMSMAGSEARFLFSEILKECVRDGATVDLHIDNAPVKPESREIWEKRWRRFQLGLQRGNLGIGASDEASDEELLRPWLLKFAAALTTLLPLEAVGEELLNEDGLPEGAVQRIEVNRYERDRRNRAAALAIHGYSCAACEFNFGAVYGEVANGFIEVHHVVPVSRMTAGYMVNPVTDLVPLCPNCHSVAHKRNPPFTVEEIKALLKME